MNGVDPEDFDPGIVARESQCQTCAHRHPSMVTCEAFPGGIPLVILVGEFDHTNPYVERGEVLDQGLRYEPE